MWNSYTLNRLFHSPMVGHVVVDGSGQIQHANPAFARFIRYSAQQLKGLTFSSLLLTPLTETSGEIQVRLRFRGGDGSCLWGDACILPLGGEGDEQGGYILQVCDVTRAHMEHELHKGRAQVLELLYREHGLSEICEAIVRYIESLKEGVRCSILLLDVERGTLHKAAAPSLPDFYNDAIEGMQIGDGVGSCGTAVFRRERVIVPDILTHPYWERARRLVSRTPMRACWSEPIVAHDGSVLGSFALYYDETREPQPEELDLIASAASLAAVVIGYKRSEEAMRDLDRIKDEFITTAAHELRTPLAAIMGYADLMRISEVDPDAFMDYAAEICSSSETLARLVGDLFDISLMRLGRPLDLKCQEVELLPLLERVVGHFRRQSSKHQIELRCSSELPSSFNCDAGRVTQVLENLLGNAVKYSPHGGVVALEVGKGDASLNFCVSDQGIGMSKVEIQRAFDKYYRAEGARGSTAGLGIGLHLVRRIVEFHGGEICLESRPQEGTRVIFTLPL